MGKSNYVIGLDYGTDSVRCILVDAADGTEVSSSVFYYPRWKKGLYCDPVRNQFRQHPLDYIEGLEHTVKSCLNQAGSSVAENVRAISIDTTGSTPVMVDEQGIPLSLKDGFTENPNAMFILWKDHTSVKEAEEINRHAENFEQNYLKYAGGIYSSEWFWAKLLHVLRNDKAVSKAAWSMVEHCDWMPFLLTGGHDLTTMKRSVCAAGHKALYAAEFGGLPPEHFFESLDPLLAGFTSRLYNKAYPATEKAGIISDEWAERLGLPKDVIIGVGAFDAHMGAVGGQIEPYYLSKVMGTSTCDILVAPESDLKGNCVKGICGQVDGSVIPGMIGLEAGQSAFGDSYAWFRKILMWPLNQFVSNTNLIEEEKRHAIVREAEDKMIAVLSEEASKIDVSEKDELAVDWFNGRRTPDANQALEGAFKGLSLGTDAPRMFKAIAEATCFGARSIIERFEEEGVPVKGLIGLGGVAKKSPFIMQMLSDITQMPIKVHSSDQTCAAGAAMFAATIAGVYEKVEDAMKAMGSGFETEYLPDSSRADIYNQRYEKFKEFGQSIEHLT